MADVKGENGTAMTDWKYGRQRGDSYDVQTGQGTHGGTNGVLQEFTPTHLLLCFDQLVACGKEGLGVVDALLEFIFNLA